MNNVKNTLILVLSLIIIIQSAFLLYVMRRGPALPKKISRPSDVKLPQAPKKVMPVAPEAPEKEAVLKEAVSVQPGAVAGKIALVIDDWGYNLRNKDFITGNDFHLTLSILPFKPYSTHVAQLARYKQKDIIIHMPMEPHHKENYGLENNTILTTMDKETVEDFLARAQETVPYAKGMSNHMGSRATEDKRLMKIVMRYLKKRGLFFLDSVVTSRSVCRSVAQSQHLGFAARDIFIDNEADEDYIRRQMLKLAQKAKEKGLAVGIAHDRPVTIAALNKIIPELQAQGYRFVNLSEVVNE